MQGIKFKGIHSNEIPAVWKTNKRPVLSPPKTFYEDAPEIDSQYDFSEVNEERRIRYNDRVFEGTLSLKGKTIFHLQVELTRLSRWFAGGWGELIFDDMPYTIWSAKVENLETVAYELGRIGRAVIYFRAKPFSTWFYNSQSGDVLLGDPLMLDTNLPLDHAFLCSFDFTDSTSFEINNYGDWHTRPVIQITGSFGYVEIGNGQKALRYNGGCTAGNTVIIDCQKHIVTKDGINDTVNSTGDFIELRPGINELTIDSNGSGQAMFNFDYNFIYGAVV